MKGKLLFVSGAAVGYVLGTRAGRKRYEQIKDAAQSVWNTPVVQQGVEQVKGFALARVGTVSDAVFDSAKKLVNAATKQSTVATETASDTATTVGTPAPATASSPTSTSATSTSATSTTAKSTTAKSTAAKSTAKTPKADG